MIRPEVISLKEKHLSQLIRPNKDQLEKEFGLCSLLSWGNCGIVYLTEKGTVIKISDSRLEWESLSILEQVGWLAHSGIVKILNYKELFYHGYIIEMQKLLPPTQNDISQINLLERRYNNLAYDSLNKNFSMKEIDLLLIKFKYPRLVPLLTFIKETLIKGLILADLRPHNIMVKPRSNTLALFDINFLRS